MQIHLPDAPQRMAPDRKRVVPMIVPALLGAAIILEATPVFSRIQTSQPPQPSQRFRVLTGLIAYTDPRQGFAIIGDSVQNTFLVRPGQQLPDGAWIREIHARNVVLEREGSLETLAMHERSESPGTAYAVMPPPPMPQQSRWQEEELRRAIEAGMRPHQGRPVDMLSGSSMIPSGLSIPGGVAPTPGETRQSEMPANAVRPTEVPPTDTPPSDAASKQAQPQGPVPEAQEPADEFGGDARRQKADSRGK
jgi:hypothetical protein